VRFVPREYIAPHRVTLDLTPRQREILQILAGRATVPLRGILDQLANPPASATLRDDLYHLKRLGLISSQGYGRGAVWMLVRKVDD
jgi:ATP-dependent DNA helicase RecG